MRLAFISFAGFDAPVSPSPARISDSPDRATARYPHATESAAGSRVDTCSYPSQTYIPKVFGVTPLVADRQKINPGASDQFTVAYRPRGSGSVVIQMSLNASRKQLRTMG